MKRKKNQRLSKEEIRKIKDLTLNGKSLREISKIMDLNITTIYYQVRKFKPKQQKEFVVNLPEEKIGELIGAFAGDGSYYYCTHGRSGFHRVRYASSLSKELEYSQYLANLLKKLNLNPFFSNRKDNCVEVIVNSIGYINLIREYLIWEGKKTYSVRLKKKINSYSNEFLKGFARGLIDTDGCMGTSCVLCSCTSEELIKNLYKIFKKFGMDPKTHTRIRTHEGRQNLFTVRLNKKDLKKYHQEISFSNAHKLRKLTNILNKINGATRI